MTTNSTRGGPHWLSCVFDLSMRITSMLPHLRALFIDSHTRLNAEHGGDMLVTGDELDTIRNRRAPRMSVIFLQVDGFAWEFLHPVGPEQMRHGEEDLALRQCHPGADTAARGIAHGSQFPRSGDHEALLTLLRTSSDRVPWGPGGWRTRHR